MPTLLPSPRVQAARSSIRKREDCLIEQKTYSDSEDLAEARSLAW